MDGPPPSATHWAAIFPYSLRKLGLCRDGDATVIPAQTRWPTCAQRHRAYHRLWPDVPGNKAKRGREAPVPADLVELKSFHRRERKRPLFGISRQWVSKSMKAAVVAAGIDSSRN